MSDARPNHPRVLIVCSHFWPSSGGVESRMGQFSTGLVRAGYDVSVLTQALPNRTSDDFHGVRILSSNPLEFPAAIRQAVASGDFDTCILIQDPLGNIIWSLEGLTPPPQTRVLIQPIINEDGYSRWKDHPQFPERLAAILKAASAALVMTKTGPDTRYMQRMGIDAVYLPNATKQVPAAGDFRKQYGIPEDRFVILHVANLYWVKNHVGLLDALQDLPPSWQLVLVGNPSGEPDCVAAVQARLAGRPEVLFIPGLSREWTSAAIQAADVQVLASLGEGSPITILEAMSHQKPWLATPQCGAANDHTGGLICTLDQFKSHLHVLDKHRDLKDALASIGYRHWQQCYSWPVALGGWIDLIEQGRLQQQIEPSPALVAEMADLRQRIKAALAEIPAAPPAADPTETLFRTAKAGQLGVIELINGAESLIRENRPDQAAELYRAWLKHTDSPLRYAAAFNLAALLQANGTSEEAEQAYRRTLAYKNDFAPARFNLAALLEQRGHLAEAAAHWRWICQGEHGVAAANPELYLQAQGKLQGLAR